MEILAFVLMFIVLLVLLSMKSSTSSSLRELQQKIDALSRHVEKLNRNAAAQNVNIEERTITHASPSIEAERLQQQRAEEERKEKLRLEKENERKIREQQLQRERERQEAFERVQREVTTTGPQVQVDINRSLEPPATKPGFFERNPDLEKFIGENLANKIGIAILVVGIGFFVKYAIDQEWINEIGRVAIGVLCGGILLGVAHRLRNSFAAFSSVLVGGGIAVLYFTIAIAFHEYHIFPQTVAFIIMVVITAFAVVLSLAYNRVELAVLAILGGFGAPFMVSTGEGNYVVLFSYMLILNIGMLILAYYKKWRIVNIVSYAFTIIIYGGWLSTRFNHEDISMIRGALIFATLFYIIFFVMNVVNNIRQRARFEALEIITLLSNTFMYYTAGMIILSSESLQVFQGLFTATLAIFNFVFAYALYKNARADKNLVFMLIGLVLTFVSLAAPIQLKGNYITLFWAAEAVLLLWLSQKSGIRLMKVASVLVMGLMVVSLLMDWRQIYIDHPGGSYLTIFLNKGFITSLTAIASLFLTLRLLKNENDDQLFKTEEYRIGIVVLAVVLLYFGNVLELRHQLLWYIDSYSARMIYAGCYNMMFIGVIMIWITRAGMPRPVVDKLFIGGVMAAGIYLAFYHTATVDLRNEILLGTEANAIGFSFHYMLVALMIFIVVLSVKNINTQPALQNRIQDNHWWGVIFLLVFVASAELDHLVVWSLFNEGEYVRDLVKQNHKIGFPILWGISSFMIIAIGLQKKIKKLRIVALVLFLVTLVKLFAFDLRDLSEGGKIAAFISLGVLLLIVSFMYQRLKKLLIEDEEPQQTKMS